MTKDQKIIENRVGLLELAKQLGNVSQACKILGMAGATEEAVDCLREAFSKPSFAFPFLEPYLPYYDPIRNEPAFVELLAEGQ